MSYPKDDVERCKSLSRGFHKNMTHSNVEQILKRMGEGELYSKCAHYNDEYDFTKRPASEGQYLKDNNIEPFCLPCMALARVMIWYGTVGLHDGGERLVKAKTKKREMMKQCVVDWNDTGNADKKFQTQCDNLLFVMDKSTAFTKECHTEKQNMVRLLKELTSQTNTGDSTKWGKRKKAVDMSSALAKKWWQDVLPRIDLLHIDVMADHVDPQTASESLKIVTKRFSEQIYKLDSMFKE